MGFGIGSSILVQRIVLARIRNWRKRDSSWLFLIEPNYMRIQLEVIIHPNHLASMNNSVIGILLGSDLSSLSIH